MEGHEDAIEAAKLRMLRTAAATRDQGAATLQQMEDQGEQMRRIQGDQAKVQQNLDTSDKILKGMTSFLGWRAWGQSSTTSGKAKAVAVYSKDGKDLTKDGKSGGAAAKGTPRGCGGAAGGGPSTLTAGGAGGAGGGEADDPMDSIAQMMSEMHQQALAMNSELKNQSTQLDGLVETTQDHQAKVAKNTKRTAAVGGKKAKQEMNDGALSTAQEMANRVVAGKPPISARTAARMALQG